MERIHCSKDIDAGKKNTVREYQEMKNMYRFFLPITIVLALMFLFSLHESYGDPVTSTGIHGWSSVLPNPSLTPGVINPDVTQANIRSTICIPGFTKTVRPKVSYTNKLKKEQIGQYGYADKNMHDYEEDHLISLEIGGSPTSPQNLWPEPYAGSWGARTKDRIEDRLHKLVCTNQIPLEQAQIDIATNWVAAYQKYIGAR